MVDEDADAEGSPRKACDSDESTVREEDCLLVGRGTIHLPPFRSNRVRCTLNLNSVGGEDA